MRKRIGLAAGLLILVAFAGAQMDFHPLDAGGMMLNHQLFSGLIGLTNSVTRRATRGGAAPAGAPLTYRRDLAVTERVKRDYLARAAQAYGSKFAGDLRQFFATNGFVAVWTKGSASDGMHPGDLGDSMAEYWVTNWAIANGLASTTPAQAKALRCQIGPIVAANPQVRGLSDAKKQALSETLMLNLVVEALGAKGAQQKGDPVQLQKLRTQTALRFEQDFGIDLKEVKLTDAGLVRA